MAVVSEPRPRFVFPRLTVGAVCAGIIAFVAAGHAHGSVSHGVGVGLGVALALFALAPSLGEISTAAQKWTAVAGTIALGATLGLLMRLFTG